MLLQIQPLTGTFPLHSSYRILYNAPYAWIVRIVLIPVLQYTGEKRCQNNAPYVWTVRIVLMLVLRSTGATRCQNNARAQCRREVPAGNVFIRVLPMTHALQQLLIFILVKPQLASRWNL